MEVDVVMDANTPLWKAHDISQMLQDKIEVLPNVGRAFVHVDHETTHYPVSLPPCFCALHPIDCMIALCRNTASLCSPTNCCYQCTHWCYNV